MSPVAIQKIGHVLAIAWEDGREDYIELAALREACPCAVCRGEGDVFGRRVAGPARSAPPSSDLVGWAMVGGYGIQPRWADGHATGIFSFSLLRELARKG